MASTTNNSNKTQDTLPVEDAIEGIEFIDYRDESQIDSVMSLVGRDLSEPYSSTCFASAPSVLVNLMIFYSLKCYYSGSLYLSLLFASVSPTLYFGSEQGASDRAHCLCRWKDGYRRRIRQWQPPTSQIWLYWNVGSRSTISSTWNWIIACTTRDLAHETAWMHGSDSGNGSFQQGCTATLSRNVWIYTRRTACEILSELG